MSGQTTYARDIESFLQAEHEYYQDTLLGDAIPVEDSYFTLHKKSISFMRWLLLDNVEQRNTFSRRLRYLVMLDDDVYLRLPHLMEKLRAGPAQGDYRGEVS